MCVPGRIDGGDDRDAGCEPAHHVPEGRRLDGGVAGGHVARLFQPVRTSASRALSMTMAAGPSIRRKVASAVSPNAFFVPLDNARTPTTLPPCPLSGIDRNVDILASSSSPRKPDGSASRMSRPLMATSSPEAAAAASAAALRNSV